MGIYLLVLVVVLLFCYFMIEKQSKLYKRLTPEELEDYQKNLILHIEGLMRGYEKNMEKTFDEYLDKVNKAKSDTNEDILELLDKAEILKSQLDEKVEKIEEFKKLVKI